MEKMVKITTTVPESAFLAIKGFAEVGRFNLSYSYLPEKKASQKDIFNRISDRYNNSDFLIEYKGQMANDSCVVISHPKKNLRFGFAKCNPNDVYKWEIGYYLALARACGWKDLEEELFSTL